MSKLKQLQGAEGAQGAQDAGAKKDNVVDAEFEEVKKTSNSTLNIISKMTKVKVKRALALAFSRMRRNVRVLSFYFAYCK